MSATVWKEEVDKALVAYIQSIVKVTRNSVWSSVPAIVRKPEEEFKEEQYPIVSIYNLFDSFSKIRYNPHKQVVSKFNGVAVLEDPCKPFELFYQIDFWAKYQTDMNEMTRMWLSKNVPDFVLPVRDTGGTLRQCYALMTEPVRKSDLLSESKRVFHSFGTYRISVAIDENTRENIPIVLTIDNRIENTITSQGH